MLLLKTKFVLSTALLLFGTGSIAAQKQDMKDWVEFVKPGESMTEYRTVSGTIALTDYRLIGRMKPSKFNQMVLSELQDQLARKKGVGSVLGSLRLTGYGAPAGNYRRNESRSMARAGGLKAFLLESELCVGELNVSWVAEDWDSLRVLIADSRLPLRHAALDIIRTIDVTKGRERQLCSLGGGEFYRAMCEQLCPLVCRIEWTASLMTDRSAGMISLENGKKVLSLYDLYEMAWRFEPGSADFCNAIDICYAHFPGSDVAQLNAAAVALIRGSIPKAKAILENYTTDPRAYNNLSLLYERLGNGEKADLYARLALANGSEAARRRLVKDE